ncbi:hypothetical protein R6Z07M_001960 [Ovis aries]
MSQSLPKNDLTFSAEKEVVTESLQSLRSSKNVVAVLLMSPKAEPEGFPGGSVIKNPPGNAGDTGSIPGLGISHMLRSN